MELILFCLCNILIARYFNKRSKLLVIIHSVFFIIILPGICFKTDLPFIVEAMRRLFGDQTYETIRYYASVPCIWLYSTNVAIYFLDILLVPIVTFGTAVHVTKKLLKKGKAPFSRKLHSGRNVSSSKIIHLVIDKIFLRYCRLLN